MISLYQTIKVKFTKLFWVLMVILPIIDSLNGLFNGGQNEDGLSIGIIYRIFIAVLCITMICMVSIPLKTLIFYALFALYCFLSVSLNPDASTYLLLLFRLILPMLIITTVEVYHSNELMNLRQLDALFVWWEIAFPLSILIPYLLGIGFQTYGNGSVGYKGLYYAQNDIGYILGTLYLFSIYRLWKKLSFANLIVSLAILTFNLVLGLKSNYLMVGFVTVIYVFNLRDVKRKWISKLIGVLIISGGIVFVLSQYRSEIQSIILRWQYFYYQEEGLSFWTSSRIERVPVAYDWVVNQFGSWGIVWGTGLGYMAHTVFNASNFVEMDFFDILFQLGVIGVIFVYGFYVSRYKKYCPKGAFKWAFLLAIICSTLAGHVLESALSGMFFAMVCSGMILSNRHEEKESSISHGIKRSEDIETNLKKG